MKANKFKLNTDVKSNGKNIHNSISKLDGINSVRLDSFANTVTVNYDDSKVSSSEIESILRQKNYL
ncbi:heavy-metal-associated domain-containing protein [Serpentinicella alkaliphila]|uniref:Heavy-metal-associated domain-containing protein n=1 Tax=Serpentinicella alkaliphila TaxID=1734049 RepID=A0A4R2U2D0_9FIRM|nr:cation transporter [Serpentinicella alkaliphila]QUH26735.1 cation transporter [Serpentinicella alkaliphila]TCQ07955.1 heavy-metal-associated domain-containing protein [Serpentinicella alkaliphila]